MSFYKDSYPFSVREREMCDCLIRLWLKYNPKIASFLYIISNDKEGKTGELDLSNIEYRWIDSSKGPLGAFDILTPNIIYFGNTHIENIDEMQSNGVCDKRIDTYALSLSSLLMNFGIFMHEFYHMFQFKACPVGYIAMRFVTLFTKFPFYLSQADWMKWLCPDGENTHWVKVWGKLTVWDLEGQAEKYGNKAEKIDEFVKYINCIFSAYCFRDSMMSAYKKRKAANNGVDPEDGYDIDYINGYMDEQKKDYDAYIFKLATELYKVYLKNV